MPKEAGFRRKVVLSFALSGALVAVGCAIAGVEMTRRIINSRRLETTINRLGWATRTVEQAYVAEGEDGVAGRLLEVRRTLGARYCAVLGVDGRWQTVVGDTPASWEPRLSGAPASGLRCERVSGAGGTFEEIRTPLYARGNLIGELVVGLSTPDIWALTRECFAQPPLLLILPLILCLGSGIWLTRSFTGTASVAQVLGEVSGAESIDVNQLRTVPATDAVAIGWNRLVNTIHRFPSLADAGQVEQAVREYGRGRGTDVLESMQEAVAVTDTADRIRYANPAFRHLSGMEPEQLRGRTVAEVLKLPDDALQSSAPTSPQLAGAMTVEIARRLDGAEQILRVQRIPIRATRSETPTGFAWIIRDITQQKIAQQMKTQFIVSAIHELRTPLSNIRAYAETLAALDDINIDKQKEFCNIITTEAIRLGRLIDDLLNLSRMDAGAMCVDRAPTDVGRLVEDVVLKMRPGAEEKQIKFVVETPDKYFPARIDKQKIAVALVNLLGNAIKYTPPGGEVVFRVTQTEQELVFMVSDTGIGISEEDLPHIFDRFYRARDERVEKVSGSGIGLALVKEIVELHGGTISVKSRLNEGSTFIVRVPTSA